MNTGDTGILCIFSAIISFVLGIGISGNIQIQKDMKAAIDAGVGKYIVNEKTGATTFTFITNNLTK